MTIEERIKCQIGDLVFQIQALHMKIEALQKENAELKKVEPVGD